MRTPYEVSPGYYSFPGFPNYAVSPDGRVINLDTKEELIGSILSEYVHFTLYDRYGRRRLRSRCRLLMLAFKNPGFIAGSLQVNHIDGNKLNDDLNNLEWITPKENCEHAGAIGLSSKCMPISVRDVDTGEIRKFPSIIECAREFGISKDMINYRVQHGEHRVYPERKQYRKGHHDSTWVVYEEPELRIIQYGRSKHALVKFVLTGEVLRFNSLVEVATHLNVTYSTVAGWMSREGQPIFPGYVQLKWVDDKSPWRQVNDPYLELACNLGVRPVKVTNKEGDVQVFLSGVECAKEKGLLTTTLNNRLKSSGKTVFADGCRYEYYTSGFSFDSPTM
jgi:hypothetical protein